MSEISPQVVSASAQDPLAELRHDLCTPINQILGYSELLEEEASEDHPDYVDDLRKIQKAATTMLAMVRGRLNADLLKGDLLKGSTTANRAQPDTHGPPLPHKAIVDAGEEPVGATASSPVARPGRILAVDDDALNLDVLAQRLTRQGHLVSTAADGEEALVKARQHPFDLVLLDVMMPRLDGYGALAAFKADEQLRSIPVIMISALDELSSVVRCIEAGAEDYLPKPFNATLLRARVGACLEKKFAHDQEVALYHRLVMSQQRLDRELSQAHRQLAAMGPEVREDPQLAPLLEAFQRMSGAVSRRETDLRATIQDLEIKINRKAVTTHVTTIVADPSFTSLSERARAMRARRRSGGAGSGP
jgi:sigma-B regulation protein RsbU (phosphoserine phosphatase)